MHTKQGSYAKIASAKFEVFVLPYGQRFETNRKKQKLKGSEMNIVRSYNNWRRYRETVSQLGRLTNRELNDLGINRGDIEFVAIRSATR